jgi:hypothetical protein
MTRMCYRGDNTVASWNQDMTDPGTKKQFENSSLKESIHCKSLYSQGIRQCPYEVAKIV